jgi:hypothetical protein
VVRVVVREDDVGHRLGVEAVAAQRTKNRLMVRDQARVDNQDQVSVPDETDGGRDSLVRAAVVALEQDVDTRHC